MSEATADRAVWRRTLPAAVLALAAAVVAALLVPTSGAGAADRGTAVKVMARNVYLGVNLRPAVDLNSFQELANFAGQAIAEEQKNNFRVRSRGLAREIIKNKPDLVGLQEVSRYTDAPCTDNPIPPSASNVRIDYLQLLMKRLNAGKKRYRVVISQPEFDFQVWANTDGNESTSGPGCPFGSEIQIRLNYFDVMLARLGAGVRTRRAKSGNFDLLFQPKPAGFPVTVARGWAAVDATVRGSRPFRFVTTHLEAYDDTASNETNKGTTVGKGKIREAQAKELYRKGGPARGRLPVVLVGDINSDDNTVQGPDRLAYLALKRKGFVSRSPDKPSSCCIKADLLTVASGGKTSDFDHHIDHVLTNRPRKIRLIDSKITGRRPVNGFWSGDHAGVFSKLRILP